MPDIKEIIDRQNRMPIAHVFASNESLDVCVHFLLLGEDGNCITSAPWMPSCELEVLWKAFSVE